MTPRHLSQPGQIMAAVALAQGRQISDDDLDGIRNVCRCGTYNRIARRSVTAPNECRPRDVGRVLYDDETVA